ncbi:site-specific DNA-methyltransferase [Curtobacterium sp. MCBA15_004]|uniref:site-specific DNA-methyltransferase n=1 Tax=unclassified Curtobacterium TaxID=257496 RepID=UPI0008DD3124|nr:site-specific DNA-methyltransferase [Curtobacterium sp. MCBA15_004]WIA97995.1 site-specific DNA-methyltransferase [Curtobacterium sp. MCBA15_004]
MAHIDYLVRRVADPDLRGQIAEEVAKLVERKDFGLVFQQHRPEDVETPGVRPRRGDRVRIRGDLAKRDFHVTAAAKGVASLLPLDSSGQVLADASIIQRSIDGLVVVKDFDHPVYPGLELVQEIDAGGDKPPQVVINGENYYALEALLYTHTGQVDVIYIDPPYNTGADDWQYNDRYVEGSDAYRHSKWLSFMERRLKHAKQLLKPTGVLFMSIDDNEQAHLRLLADDIFGQSNFLDTIVVEMSTTSGPKVVNAQQGTIVKNAEFVHVYRRGPQFDEVQHTPLLDGVSTWDKNYSLWLESDGTVSSFLEQLSGDPAVRADIERFGLMRANRFAGMTSMDKLLMLSGAAVAFIERNVDRIARTDRVPMGMRSEDVAPGTWRDVQAGHRTYTLTKTSGGNIMQVVRLARNYRMSDDYRPRYGRTVIRGDLWKGFHSDMAHVGLEGRVPFGNGKKPVRLVKQLIKWANNSPDAVILDFFGGSGTTTHAVMSLNADDEGRRQSILVTNNEVSKVTAARLRRAGFLPGDREWEQEGVFEAVTVPRIANAVRGSDAQDASQGAPLNENVHFYKLTYQDENQVALDRRFEAIAPLLWMKAGAIGDVIRSREERWALSQRGTYGVLFDVAAAREFAGALEASQAAPRHLFVVAESESAYRAAVSYFPDRMRSVATRLYADYLRSFEINGEG